MLIYTHSQSESHSLTLNQDLKLCKILNKDRDHLMVMQLWETTRQKALSSKFSVSLDDRSTSQSTRWSSSRVLLHLIHIT